MVSTRHVEPFSLIEVDDAEFRRLVGLRIKQARHAKGWSQNDLARALGPEGPASSYVSRWERGDVLPGLSYLSQLAEALDVSVAYLHDFNGDGPREPD